MSKTIKVYSESYGPNQTLALGAKVYRSNHLGVFSVPEDEAQERLLGTPGWKEGEPSEDALKNIRKHAVPVGTAQSAADATILSQAVEIEKLKAEMEASKREAAEARERAAQAEAAALRAELDALKAGKTAGATETASETAEESEPAPSAPKAASRPRRAAE